MHSRYYINCNDWAKVSQCLTNLPKENTLNKEHSEAILLLLYLFGVPHYKWWQRKIFKKKRTNFLCFNKSFIKANFILIKKKKNKKKKKKKKRVYAIFRQFFLFLFLRNFFKFSFFSNSRLLPYCCLFTPNNICALKIIFFVCNPIEIIVIINVFILFSNLCFNK